MVILLSYSFRNLWTRKLTTVLTSIGMALVVFVFSSILMMAEGLRITLISTGSFENIVILRKGSSSEVQSSITRFQASLLESFPEIALGEDGKRLFSKEIVVIISLPKRGNKKESYVTIRGIEEKSFDLRPNLTIIEGRLPRAGTHEIISGKAVSDRFEGIGLGQTIKFGARQWQIVGIFDARNTGFNSEIWVDVEQLLQTFRRNSYSSVIFRLHDPKDFGIIKERIEKDPRLQLDLKREVKYYEEQSAMMRKFLRILGNTLTIIFSIGAITGAMITMYGAVANRINEIGTLRALGFQRKDIMIAFMFESILLGVIGGGAGLVLSSFLQFFTISTINFQTFSELAFSFKLTFEIVWKSVAFSMGMGLIGGIMPAIRASRMRIVDALRVS